MKNSLLIIVCFLFFLPCHSQTTNELSEDVKTIVKGNSEFAFAFYQEIRNQPKNFFFSPYSISSAFAMTLAGAKGATALEMQDVLHFPVGFSPVIGELNEYLTKGDKAKPGETQLALANAVWVQQQLPLLPAFQLAVKQTFRGHIEALDFTNSPLHAVEVINEWVSTQTKGKIHQLLSSQDVSSRTRLVLTSAIYMKGGWVHPFNKELTAREPFFTMGGHPLQTYMMKIVETYPLFNGPHFDMIELPYVPSSSGLQLSMVILVPHSDQKLDQIEKEFFYNQWQEWMKQLKPQRVQLTMPRFRLEDRLDLNQSLQEMGMVKPFSQAADFSGITGNKSLYINKAVHKTFIRVDENGTEAAAATGITMNMTSVLQPEKPYVLTINKPFCFLIIDRHTQSILFMGRVIQP